MVFKSKVCNAIKNKQVVKFYYDGHVRIVEPHISGETSNGNAVLSAYRVGGYSESKSEPSWRYYSLDKISQWNTMDEVFEKARRGYNRNDSKIKTIYCRL